MRAFLRYSGDSEFRIVGHPLAHRHFVERFDDVRPAGTEVTRILPWDLHGLAQAGNLFLLDPGVVRAAWRRRHIGNRSYSICGITHTTSSHGIMETLESLNFAPVQAWDALICTSEAVRRTVHQVVADSSRYLKGRVGAAPSFELATPVIPLGVHADEFAPMPALRASLRGRLGLGDDDLLVLFLGRLSSHAKSNPLPLYQALQLAAGRTPRRIHLLMAGWFPTEEYRESFRSGAAIFAPDVGYHVLDARDPHLRREAFPGADIFVSLSDNIQETFGLTPIEAMAAGLPAVVSDWDGYRDTIRDGLDGFMIPTLAPPPGNERDLAMRYATDRDSYDHYIGHAAQFVAVDIGRCADALAELFNDDERRREMGAAARKRVLEAFDWPVIIRRYQELWRELAERRGDGGEVAAAVPGEAARPAWGDPSRLFAHYPSRQWNDRLVVEPRGSPELLGKIRSHPFANLSRGLLCSEEEIARIWSVVSAAKAPMPAAAVVALFPPPRAPIVRRTLLWMAKFGLIALGAPRDVAD